MSAARQRPYRRLTSTAAALIGVGVLMSACTSNEPESQGGGSDSGNEVASSNDETGETVVSDTRSVLGYVWENSVLPIWEDGKVAYVLTTAIDATPRHRARRTGLAPRRSF